MAELSALDTINKQFGIEFPTPAPSVPSVSPVPATPVTLAAAAAPRVPAETPPEVSPLESINRQFGISFETSTPTPAVAPTAAGPSLPELPAAEVAPTQTQPPPAPGGGGGAGLGELEPSRFAPSAEIGTAERLSRHFVSGALGTAEGMGGALQWVTGGALGKDFSDYMVGLRKEITPQGEASFVDQLASGAGSMATFFIPGFGVARGLSLAARVAPKAASWLGAGTMAITEAATEAGTVYRSELEKGKDPERAGNAASWTFWLNLPVLTLTDKIAFFGTQGKALSRALRGMVTEGSQESLQEVISTWSQEEQQNLKNILTSGAVGALLGGGVGAIAKPLGVPQEAPPPSAITGAPVTPEIPVGGAFNRAGMEALMGEGVAPPAPALPPGTRAEGPPVAAVEPGAIPPAIAPPPAEVAPELALRTPSGPMGVGGTETQVAATAALGIRRAPPEPRAIPKAVEPPEVPAPPVTTSGDAAQTLGARKPPAPVIAPTEKVQPAAPGEAVPEGKTPVEAAPPVTDMEAVRAFQNKFGTSRGVGAPEGQLTGGERMIPGETPSPDTPGISYHEAFPRADIQLNPDVWQHKMYETGAGQALSHVKNKSEWDAVTSRGIQIYRYPDGHTELMDGHSRTTAGDRVGVDRYGVTIYDGNFYPVEVARAHAALTNIRMGTGTAVDSAKAMRDFGLTPETLREKGVDLNGEHTRIALGLANLSDEVFTLVARGDFPAKKGAIIGEQLPGNFEAQNAIYKLIQKKHTDKNGVISISDEKLKNDIRFAEFSKVMPTNQPVLGDVFEESMRENLVNENSELMTFAARKLSTEKNLFKTVTTKSAQLVAAGNQLKPEANKKISDDAAMGLAILDKAPFISGTETNRLFKEFAVRLTETSNKTPIKEEFYAKLPQALEADRDTAGLGTGAGRGVRQEVSATPPGAPEGGPGASGEPIEPTLLSLKDIPQAESALGLSPREKPTSKLNARLDQIQADYPGADREKIALVIRALPNAEDGQIVNMAADPEMFAQVARGNLAASEKAQLLKKATDAGAQQGLPGMGKPEGETLFKVTEEAAPTIPYEEPITLETAKREMGKAGYLVKEAQVGDASGYHVTLPNSKMIFVITGKEFAKPTLEEVKGTYPEMTQEKLDAGVIAGEWQSMSLGGIAYLAEEAGVRTFRHEVNFHGACDLVLTGRELKAVLRDYGDWEAAARVYEDYNPYAGPKNTILHKIWEFYRNLMHLIRPTGESTLAKIESGEVWLRKEAGPGTRAIEKGLPEALAPKMKAEWEKNPVFEKQALAKALHRGELTLEEYNARYADKYGEWDSAKWAESFPDFATMGVRMAREDGTVVSKRKFRVKDEERQGWVAPGEPKPSFKEFEANLAKDDNAWEKELRNPASSLIPLYEGETYQGTRRGDFIKDAKGKTVKLTNEDIYERLYNPKTATLPMGTETAKPEDLLGTPEKPGPEGTVEKPPGYAGSLVRSVREKFSAANISEKSRLAHQFIVEHLGWAAREVKKDAAILDKYSDRFGAMTRENLIAFTDAVETGQLDQVAPDLQEAAQAWRRISDGLHSLLVDAKGGESAYWENYFPRLFKDPEKAAIAIAQMLKSRGTSLTGPESFNKARTQLLFSDSIKPVEEGGLGLEPRYPNYVDMMKANIYEKMRFLTGKYIESDLKDAGFITKNKTPGWEALTGDKTLEGYYAHPDVARVMDNFLSKGLRGDPLFELYNSPVSFINTVLVGMSAFHATFSTFSDLAHGIGSNLTRAVGAAVTGRFGLSGHYLAEMAKASNIPANVIRGGKLGEEYITPGSHPEIGAIVDLMTKAGIRFESPGFVDTLKAIFKPGGTSQSEMGQMSKSFAEVAAQQMGVPRKIMESIAWPIMSYLVPRLKINATARLLQMELDTLTRSGKIKDMTPQDLTALAQEVARKSDNIFGQMVYDNLSMKRGMRDGLRVLVGFPGWNIGSFTDILQAGKGMYQASRSTLGAIRDIATGQKPTWENLSRSNRMSMEFYLGTALVMAVFGAFMQRMLKGDWPEDYKDLFMPRTGELMSNGQPERLRAPTYMRDVLSLNHPVEMAKHKLNFPLRMFSALVDNQDFFGTQIRDPYAGAKEQAGQLGKYVGKSLLPFGIQGYLATESPKARALNLIGITKVPRLYSNSDAMNVIDEYNKQNRATMTSKEAEEEKNLKGELRKLAKAQDEDGFKTAAQAAMEAGHLTRQQVKTIVDESQAPPGLGRFVALPVEWQVRAWAKATDQEKEVWQPYFLKKVMSAKSEILIRNRDILDPVLREMGLDVVADKIQNLKISDKAGTFKLAGLGVRKPTGEMGDIDTVDLAMAREIAAQEAKLGNETKAKKSKKPNKYGFLGIQ